MLTPLLLVRKSSSLLLGRLMTRLLRKTRQCLRPTKRRRAKVLTTTKTMKITLCSPRLSNMNRSRNPMRAPERRKTPMTTKTRPTTIKSAKMETSTKRSNRMPMQTRSRLKTQTTHSRTETTESIEINKPLACGPRTDGSGRAKQRVA